MLDGVGGLGGMCAQAFKVLGRMHRTQGRPAVLRRQRVWQSSPAAGRAHQMDKSGLWLGSGRSYPNDTCAARRHTPRLDPSHAAVCSPTWQGVKLSDKERRELEYKEQVYKLAMERKKHLGVWPAAPWCLSAVPAGRSAPSLLALSILPLPVYIQQTSWHRATEALCPAAAIQLLLPLVAPLAFLRTLAFAALCTRGGP